MHSVCPGMFSPSSSFSSETNLSENCLYVIGERHFKIYNFDGTVKWAADVNAKRQKKTTKRNETKIERKSRQNKTQPKYVCIAISRQLVH